MTSVARLTELRSLSEEDAPTASRAILVSTKAGMGLIPNMYGLMANSPGLFSTYTSGYKQFRNGSGFDAVEQEVVFLAISRYHECSYCVSVHSAVADRGGVPTEVTDAIRDGKPIADAKLQTLNEFTTTMVAGRGRPSPEDLAGFLAAGYSEKQVLEIILAISVKVISNFTNHLFDTPVDAPFADRTWSPSSV